MLTIADRIEISTGVKPGWEVRKIARHLGRDPGVISREIRRNRNADGTYRAVGACQLVCVSGVVTGRG
ncbi:helix-turn-helix domain-containing protein [Dermacoccus profundi]|uniref:helix-turn-helix domain-containing protein n=1 Tax=Dermacoccus profundi TaxID=322602 RepID=UPI00237C07FF|nr:helix-turn-helix domain-containing protein [Dermacoccus abyssi]